MVRKGMSCCGHPFVCHNEGEEHFATYLFHRPGSNNDIPVFYDYF